MALARGNRTILRDWIEKTAEVSWVPTKGGNTAMVFLGKGIDDAEFCTKLCEERGVVGTEACVETSR